MPNKYPKTIVLADNATRMAIIYYNKWDAAVRRLKRLEEACPRATFFARQSLQQNLNLSVYLQRMGAPVIRGILEEVVAVQREIKESGEEMKDWHQSAMKWYKKLK